MYIVAPHLYSNLVWTLMYTYTCLPVFHRPKCGDMGPLGWECTSRGRQSYRLEGWRKGGREGWRGREGGRDGGGGRKGGREGERKNRVKLRAREGGAPCHAPCAHLFVFICVDVLAEVAGGAWPLTDLRMRTEQLVVCGLQHIEHCIRLEGGGGGGREGGKEERKGERERGME